MIQQFHCLAVQTISLSCSTVSLSCSTNSFIVLQYKQFHCLAVQTVSLSCNTNSFIVLQYKQFHCLAVQTVSLSCSTNSFIVLQYKQFHCLAVQTVSLQTQLTNTLTQTRTYPDESKDLQRRRWELNLMNTRIYPTRLWWGLTLTKMRTLVSPMRYLPSETFTIGNCEGQAHRSTRSRTCAAQSVAEH